MPIQIERLAIHPIKGFPPFEVSEATTIRGHGIMGDRGFAVTHGKSEFEPQKSSWMRRRNFVNVAQSALLATLEADWDLDAACFSLRQSGGQALEHALAEGPLSKDLNRLLERSAGASQPSPYRLVAPMDGSSLTDSCHEGVSILNLASLQDLSESMDIDLEVKRFRGNAWISGAAPWEERMWVGRRIRVGECLLEVVKNIQRCAAVDVTPVTGKRERQVVKALRERTGHIDFGVLAIVVEGGRMSADDQILLDSGPL